MYSKSSNISSFLKYNFLLIAFILTSGITNAQRIGLGSRTAVQEPVGPSLQAQLNDYNNPKEYTIVEVSVTGTQFLDPNSMVSISGLKVGDKIKIPGLAIPTAVKKMMDFGTLDDVEIQASKVEGENIWLNIHIKERPRLYQVTFSGIKKGQRETLNDKVKLIKGRVITPTVIKNTQLLIKKHYQDKGYYNTGVKVIQIPDSTKGQATLNFVINKGKKVRVTDIQFEGNEEISDKKLKKKLKGTREKTFYRFWAPSKYVPKKYEEDKGKLIDYYRKNGYRDAVVTFDTISKDPKNGDALQVRINVEEGPKYYYRNISWTGNYLWSDEVLHKQLGIKKGDVYNPDELNKKLEGTPGNDVSSLYMDDGYLYFRLNPVEVAVEGDSIDIEMRMVEGKQATINRIILNGNTKTSDRVVLRELFTLPGQKFSKTNLIDTQRQIASMGYFDPEKIQIEPIPNPSDGTVDIQYTVEEKPSDQIELSGGWGGYIGFVGTLGLVFNNFSIRNINDRSTWRPLPSGDGQKLAVRFQANGRQFQTYSLSFSEPWLGGKKPVSFGVALTRTVYRMTDYRNMMFGGGNRTINYLGAYYNNGITFSLGKRLKKPDRNFQLTHALSLQRYRLDSLDFFSIGYNNGNSNNITFNTTLARNTLDNPQYPRRGSSLSLSATLTPPYSLIRNKEITDINNKFKWIEYHKWMLDMSWVQTITGKLVLNTRTHMGFLGNYKTGSGISPFGRFIVGGSGLAGQGMFVMADQDIIALRGYEDRSVGPLTSSSNIVPAGGGGVVYNKYVMELRYPVSLNPQATIYLLAFAEGGNNWGSYNNYNPFDIKRSAGVGARIFMPAFGLLGIDYGYGFDKIQGRNVPSGGQFHFTIGQQLR